MTTNETGVTYKVFKWYARPPEGENSAKYDKEANYGLRYYNHLVYCAETFFRKHRRMCAKRMFVSIRSLWRKWAEAGLSKEQCSDKATHVRNKAYKVWKKQKFPTKDEMKAFRLHVAATWVDSAYVGSSATRENTYAAFELAFKRWFTDIKVSMRPRDETDSTQVAVCLRTAVEARRPSWSLTPQEGESDLRRHWFTLRIPKTGEITLRTLVDRPIPEGARVVMCRIVKEPRGPLPTRWWVQVTLAVPVGPPPKRDCTGVTVRPGAQVVCTAAGDDGDIRSLTLYSRSCDQSEAKSDGRRPRYEMREARLNLWGLKSRSRAEAARVVAEEINSLPEQSRPTSRPVSDRPEKVREYLLGWVRRCPKHLHCKRGQDDCFNRTTKEYDCWFHRDLHDEAHGYGATKSGQRSRLDLYRKFARELERKYGVVRVETPQGGRVAKDARNNAYHLLTQCLKNAFGKERYEEVR